MTSRFGPQHERYAAWFERRRGPRNPADEAALLAMADAFDSAQQTGTLSAEHLRRIVEGVSSSRMLLWSNAADLLGKLSGKWPAAADAIATMSRDRKAHVRFAALCSLGDETPVGITDAILKAGFSDKSSQVRWKVVDRANRLERRNLVSEITKALANESNERARRSMEYDLRTLRDGYLVQQDSAGRFSVTARRHNGSANRTVSDDELRTKGLEKILAELRKDGHRAARGWGE
jgi:hypothetical protein